MFSLPKSSEYLWTKHAQAKMNYYKISPARVRRVIKSPMRIEEGIAPDTVAFMQPVSYKIKNGIKSWNQEFWVMTAAQNKKLKIKYKNETSEFKANRFDIKDKGLRIISAWRYPGMTKPGMPLPKFIIDEIRQAI